MESFRNILVGVDFGEAGSLSAGSRLAVEQARWIAANERARVTLLHSTRFDEYWSVSEGDFSDRMPYEASAARVALEAARASLRDAGIEVEIEYSEQRAWLAIVERVIRSGVDLVLVGKRSDREHDGRLLGSVAQKLVRKCPCAVWVVKPGAPARIARLLAATDLSPVGDRVVSLAASLAEQWSAELHVVHALQLPLSVQIEGPDAERQYTAESRTAAVAEIESRLSPALKKSAELHVGLTSPSRAILECADRLKPELVVMGTIARGGVAGLMLGNTAERMLGRLDCSLLTVKPDDFACPIELGRT
ncbi:MAG TPA: universal stress protein [Myxococcota bacterium]|nr:universal stress protein [Myxococcota bacterium]